MLNPDHFQVLGMEDLSGEDPMMMMMMMIMMMMLMMMMMMMMMLMMMMIRIIDLQAG